MDRSTNPSLDRRQLLRNGGLMLSMGAVVAACGSTRGGSTDPGRLGVADEATELEQAPVTDIVLLRTAQSLEYTALAVYEAADATGALTSAQAALAGRFVEDHTGHAASIGSLIGEHGGAEFTCANPFLMDRAVAPILGALEGSDDVQRDLLNIAHAFESLAGASYQALVGSLVDLSLRKEMMRIGGEEHRHAAGLAAVINPDSVYSPAMFGEPLLNDADGFPIPYQIPSTFGLLTGIELVVGAQDNEGARLSTQLQTPAQNSFVYEHLKC